MRKLLLLGFIFNILGCSQVEHSMSQVLDNAGSVIRSGADQMWMEPAEQKKTAARQQPVK